MNSEYDSCIQCSANTQLMKWYGLLNDPNSNFRPLKKILTYFNKCFIYTHTHTQHLFTQFYCVFVKKKFEPHETESLTLNDEAVDHTFSAQTANLYIIFENVPTIYKSNIVT